MHGRLFTLFDPSGCSNLGESEGSLSPVDHFTNSEVLDILSKSHVSLFFKKPTFHHCILRRRLLFPALLGITIAIVPIAGTEPDLIWPKLALKKKDLKGRKYDSEWPCPGVGDEREKP